MCGESICTVGMKWPPPGYWKERVMAEAGRQVSRVAVKFPVRDYFRQYPPGKTLVTMADL